MTRFRMIAAAVLAAVALVMTACAAPAEQSAVFQIKLVDGALKPVTADALKALPQVEITVDGKPQQGPAVIDVIKQAGVTDFAQVTIKGDTGEVVLTKAELTSEVILDYANNGSVKLASPKLPIPSPVRRVTVIEVQ